MSGINADESSTHGVRANSREDTTAEDTTAEDTTAEDTAAEYIPGGSDEPVEDPKNPGGTAATHHPPAE